MAGTGTFVSFPLRIYAGSLPGLRRRDAAFLDTLRRQGVSKVDVCGIDTDICVTKCAVDLFENGIEPRVLQDHCASHAGTKTHEDALSILGRYIGRDQIR